MKINLFVKSQFKKDNVEIFKYDIKKKIMTYIKI